MDKDINNNGYDYVDLGLPSGTLWATCNVGASKPTDYGLYFQWGDTKGYTKDQVGKDKRFIWSDYKWSINGSDSNFSKYTTGNARLELEDDAAHVNMGGDWHTPTPTQIQELLDNTTTTWTTLDDVNGRLFTSKKNFSKSIFIPAAGDAWKVLIECNGIYGSIWSSMLSVIYVNGGQYLSFSSRDTGLGSYVRRIGFPVRGVIG